MRSQPDQFRNLAKIGFEYWTELRDINGKLLSRGGGKNLYTLEGFDYMLDSAIGLDAKIPNFYMGIFEAAYTPLITDTAATFPAAATECTAYTGSSRKAWTANHADGGILDNVGHEAQFTMNANKTIYGGFIASGQAKGATTGKLISAAMFNSPQVAASGNVLTLGGGCTLVNA